MLSVAVCLMLSVSLTACFTIEEEVAVDNPSSQSSPSNPSSQAQPSSQPEENASSESAASSGQGTASSGSASKPSDNANVPARGDKDGQEFNGEWVEEASYMTFYVDNQNGNDSNDGTAPSRAWKTVRKVNRTAFEPGTRILFKAGGIWNEGLSLKSSGTNGFHIIVDKYGSGAKPIINGNGEGAAVLLSNVQYVEVRNLEITNTSDTPGNRKGVYVTGGGQTAPGVYDEGGYKRHVYLINLDIHDVTANSGGRWEGGIIFYSALSKNPVAFEDVLVQGCTVKNTDANGMSFVSDYNNRVGVDWGSAKYFPSKNVVYRGNYIADVGGDGLYVNCVESPLMEYNVVTNTSWAEGAYAGMWPHNSSNTVMQFNEAFANRKVGGDGQGFDVDINCENSVVQYNYSHDNEGGFILLCTDGNANGYNRNITVRYNISQNDKDALFTLSGPISDVKIYNNSFYVQPGVSPAPRVVGSYDWGTGKSPRDVRFTNNIFYVDAAGGSDYFQIKENVVFDNNLFYGAYNFSALPQVNSILKNPLFVSPGSGGNGLNSVEGYKLKAGSPCIGAGKPLTGNGGRDYFGAAVPQNGRPDIGASQYR